MEDGGSTCTKTRIIILERKFPTSEYFSTVTIIQIVDLLHLSTKPSKFPLDCMFLRPYYLLLGLFHAVINNADVQTNN